MEQAPLFFNTFPGVYCCAVSFPSLPRVFLVSLLLVVLVTGVGGVRAAQVSGSADVAAWSPGAPREYIEVQYLEDSQVRPLYDYITYVLEPPKGSLKVFDRYIIVQGPPELKKQVKELIALWDKRPRHIIFEGTFITVQPSRVREIAHKVSSNYSQVEHKSELFPHKVRTMVADTAFGIADAFANTVLYSFTQEGNQFDFTTGYLLEEGAATVVSKPIVRVKNNGSALFKAVTNVPVSTTSQNGTNVQFRETGISLNIQNARIVPQEGSKDEYGEDYSPDLIYAEISLSDGSVNRNFGAAQGLFGTNDTTVTSKGFYRAGEAFIAASLIKDENTTLIHRTPLFSSIPLIGKAFTNTSKEQRTSETIVLLRPTIEEEPLGQKFLAARFKLARDLMPIELGGLENDSLFLHPFSTAPWRGVPEIYDLACESGTYWKLLDDYTPEQVTALGQKFAPIRYRLGIVLGQSPEQLEQQIFSDDGLQAAVDDAIAAFVKEQQPKREPTYEDFLVAAGHVGTANRWTINTYLEALGSEHTCAP